MVNIYLRFKMITFINGQVLGNQAGDYNIEHAVV